MTTNILKMVLLVNMWSHLRFRYMIYIYSVYVCIKEMASVQTFLVRSCHSNRNLHLRTEQPSMTLYPAVILTEEHANKQSYICTPALTHILYQSQTTEIRSRVERCFGLFWFSFNSLWEYFCLWHCAKITCMCKSLSSVACKQVLKVADHEL